MLGSRFAELAAAAGEDRLLTAAAPILQTLLDRLLASAHAGSRAALLDSHRLRTAEGVSALLAAAEELVHRDPGRGRQLAMLAAEMASVAQVPIARPRAHYLIARAHAGR